MLASPSDHPGIAGSTMFRTIAKDDSTSSKAAMSLQRAFENNSWSGPHERSSFSVASICRGPKTGRGTTYRGSTELAGSLRNLNPVKFLLVIWHLTRCDASVRGREIQDGGFFHSQVPPSRQYGVNSTLSSVAGPLGRD